MTCLCIVYIKAFCFPGLCLIKYTLSLSLLKKINIENLYQIALRELSSSDTEQLSLTEKSPSYRNVRGARNITYV